MKRLAILIALLGMSVGVARADSIDIQIHGSGDPTISLAAILNQWGTPGASGNTFTLPGTGTDAINGLNLLNDTGVTITSLQIFAYGVIGTGSSFSPACGDPSPTLFSACTAPGTESAGQLSAPIEWTFTGGSIANGGELRIVDQNTEPTGTALYYEIEINDTANSYTTPLPGSDPPSVPEPSSALLLGIGFAAVGLVTGIKQKSLIAA
jgi:hypothetical protein